MISTTLSLLAYSTATVPIVIGLYWAYRSWHTEGKLNHVMYAYMWLCAILSTNIMLVVTRWIHPAFDTRFMILDILETPFTISMPVILGVICFYVLHASRRRTWVLLLQILPSVALFVDYTLWYALSDMSIEQLNRSAGFHLYCRTAFNITLCTEILYLIVNLTIHYSIFNKNLVNYAADLNVSRCASTTHVIRLVWLYLILAYITILVHRISLNHCHIVLISAFLSYGAILFLMGRYLAMFQPHELIYSLKERDFTQEELNSMARWFKPTEKAEAQVEDKPGEMIPRSFTLEKNIRKWKLRKDKPYMRQNLTLVQVADEMGVSPKMLSMHLNNDLQLNFNAWINTLKIEEAKRLLVKDKSMTVSEIAIRCSYNDASTFSKVFKRITGQTPIQYRLETHS